MLVVDVKLTGIEKLGIREMNDVIRESLRDLGEYWHENMLPKHFTKAGAREYNYTPRQGEPGSGRKFAGSYTKHKLNAKGHTRPLVYSGETEMQLKNTKSIEARCSARGENAYVVVRLNAPKLNYRNQSKVKKNEEIKAVSQKEIPLLEAFLAKRLTERLTEKGQQNAAGLASITRG